MTTHSTKSYIKGKYRIRQYYTDDNLWKETKTLIKPKKKKKKGWVKIADGVYQNLAKIRAEEKPKKKKRKKK